MLAKPPVSPRKPESQAGSVYSPSIIQEQDKAEAERGLTAGRAQGEPP